MTRLIRHRQIAEALARKLWEDLRLHRGETLQDYVTRSGIFLSDALAREFSQKLRYACEYAIREARRETGAKLTFGPLDERMVRGILTSPRYRDALVNYTDEAVRGIASVVERATQRQASYRDIQRDINEFVQPVYSHGLTIARMEMANVYNQAKDLQYQKVDPSGTRWAYDWVGPSTAATTDICMAIKDHTRGRDLTRVELLDILGTVASGPLRMKGFDYDPGRPFSVHFNCRHQPRMRRRHEA